MIRAGTAIADLVPVPAVDSCAVLPAGLSVRQPLLSGDFEYLLADGAELDDGTDVSADTELLPDAPLALGEAVAIAPSTSDMPSLQDGAMAAPWLIQAVEARTGDPVAPDAGTDFTQVLEARAVGTVAPNAATSIVQAREARADGTVAPDVATRGTSAATAATQDVSTVVQLLAQKGRADFPAVVYPCDAIDQAVSTQVDVQEAIEPVLPARLINHRSSAASVPLSNQRMNLAAPHTSRTLTAFGGGEAPAPAGPSVDTFDWVARTGATKAELMTETLTASHVPNTPQQRLVDALGERLSVQMAQGMRQAVIRLESGSNGSIRIELSQNVNGMAVHLSASHADVVLQLQAIGESLRQDLCARHGGDVTVQVSAGRQGHAEAGMSGGRGHHPRDDTPTQRPGGGLASAGGDASFEFSPRELMYMKGKTI